MDELRGHSILIVESEAAPFVGAFQLAIERTGAESLLARNPATALERSERFEFSAAVINVDHRALMHTLDIPTLLYGPGETAARPELIVPALARLLRE